MASKSDDLHELQNEQIQRNNSINICTNNTAEILKVLKIAQIQSINKQTVQQQYSSKPGKGAGSGGGLNCLKCCKKVDEATEGCPLTSFEQEESTISYKVECIAEHEMDSNYWSVGVTEFQNLNIILVTKPPDIWMGRIKLTQPITDDTLHFTFENQFRKLVVTLQKPKPKLWKTIGAPIKSIHNKVINSVDSPVDYYPATIILREKVGVSNILIAVKPGNNVHFGCPVAWHIMLRIDGQENVYTPIKFITSAQSDEYDEILEEFSGQIMFFIIKIRKDGKLSPALNSAALKTPGILEMGGPRGYFDQNFVFLTDRLFIIAGGTGITPFISIIKFIKDKKKDVRVKQVVLILCASTEADLIWNDVWAFMNDKMDWFFYLPHISRGEREIGDSKKGSNHVNFEDLMPRIDELPHPPEGSTHRPLLVRGMASGPNGFTENAQQIFEKMKILPDNIKMFPG